MRVVAIGDIGVAGTMIHIGDEAMFEELAVQAGRRGVAVTAISANPADTRERYDVSAIDRIGFDFSGPGARERMRERSDSVVRAASGASDALVAGDSAFAVIDAVRESSGVVVAGGGNMASTWPMHIWERATLARLADVLGKPFVITGQTIGPDLTEADASIVGTMLRSAEVVGVREPASFDLVRSLGVADDRLQRTVDDATFVGMPGATPAIEGPGIEDPGTTAPEHPYCLVTLSLHLAGYPRDRFVSMIARALDDLVASTGARVIFFAHWGSLDASLVAGDAVLHGEIATAMTADSTVIASTGAAEAAALSRGASIALTSRYHPAVFAVVAGVPTVAIAVDEYTRVKLSGALGNFAQDTHRELANLDADGLTRVLGDAWQRRDAIRSFAEALRPGVRLASDAWWDRVFGVMETPSRS